MSIGGNAITGLIQNIGTQFNTLKTINTLITLGLDPKTGQAVSPTGVDSRTGRRKATLGQTIRQSAFEEFGSVRPLGKEYYKAGAGDLSPLGYDA